MRIQLSDHFTYKKLIKFSIPSIAMMIFTSIYGVVDGYFVSNYAGDIPFKAVNLIMPFLMMISTVGFMFGTGGTAIVAHTLGKGDIKKANSHFSLFVAVTFVIGVFLAVLLLPKLFGLDGIWLSVVVAEIMAALLSALFTVAMRKKYNYL